MKKAILILVIGILVLSYLGMIVNAQTDNTNNSRTNAETVGRLDVTICCEKTIAGLYCQDVKEGECAEGARTLPTACTSSSYCKPGTCSDPVEGTCLDNTPQKVCNDNKGNWFEKRPSQCNLGCCVIGDQASFVTLTRCKRISSLYGQETNFNNGITNEEVCILTAGAKEKGACVYVDPAEFGKKCKITTREQCTADGISGNSVESANNVLAPDSSNFVVAATPAATTATAASTTGTTPTTTGAAITGNQIANAQNVSNGTGGYEFHPGKLCSAEELGTTCGPSKQTACLPGKEEVYYLDTCGNPANIYDASKFRDSNYWSNMIDKKDSCGAGSANKNSQTCGSCSYMLGSYCREASSDTAKATYGDNICADLGCKDSSGKARLHGESWCSYDGGTDGKVGSKSYRYVCQNGLVTIEPCADFRQEECIENSRDGYSEAGCRVNRWQDCTAQKEKGKCENSDKRDCKWLAGKEYILLGSLTAANDTAGSAGGTNSMEGIAAAIKQGGGLKNMPQGACVPKMPPGLKHYDGGGEAAAICAQANAICPVTYEKGLTGGGWKCKENCECLPGGALEKKRQQLCVSLGDCGQKTNFVGVSGSGVGTRTTIQKMSSEKK